MSPSGLTNPDLPSTRTLGIATGSALLAAVAILLTVVLPAEYGIDPLGTGRRLGLDVMTAKLETPKAPIVIAGDKLAPTQDGPIGEYAGEFKVDARDLVLGPYETLEFKYHLEKGATMLFSWKASDDVIHDFHGETDTATKDEPQSYDNQARRTFHASFTAPFTGIHGWFWENPGSKLITIKLTAAGFFTSATEFHMDRTRRQREVGGLDRIAATPSPAESLK